MTRHDVLFAAFLIEPHVPAGAARAQILDLHLQGGCHARKTVGERSDEGAVAEVAEGLGWNGIEQLAHFGVLEHGRRTGFDDVLGAAHSRGRVGRDYMAKDEPIE
jgi:hypothetical protein